MKELLRAYTSKPWPKLEIPSIGRTQLFIIILYTATLIAGGWYIYLNHPRANNFFFLGMAIPLLFLLKSRYFTIIALLAFEVVMAFLFIGNSDYVFYIVTIMVLTIITFESPILMYLLFIEAIWFETWLFSLLGSNTVKFIMAGGLFLGWLIREKLSQSNTPLKLHFPEARPVILFYLWTLAGFFFWCPESIPAGWAQLIPLTIGIMVFTISPLIIKTEKHLNLALMGWVIGSIGVGIGIGIAVASPPEDIQSANLGVEWLLAFKNVTATLLSYSFFIVLAAIHWMKKKRWKIAAVMVLVLITVRIIFLASRGTVVGLGTGFILFWLVDTVNSHRIRSTVAKVARIFVLIIATSSLIVIYYLFDYVEALGSYAELLTPQATNSTLSFRVETWNIVLTIIKEGDHLVRGLGLGAFWIYSPEQGFVLQNYAENMALASPHNLWLDILLHYGVIGLGLFLIMVFTNLTGLWRLFSKSSNSKFRYLSLGLFCSLIAFYVHGGIDGQLYSVVDFWLFLGMVVATVNIGGNILKNNSELPRTDSL